MKLSEIKVKSINGEVGRIDPNYWISVIQENGDFLSLLASELEIISYEEKDDTGSATLNIIATRLMDQMEFYIRDLRNGVIIKNIGEQENDNSN